MTVECPRSCPAGVEAECLTYGGQDPMDRCRWTAMDLTNANTEVVRYCPKLVGSFGYSTDFPLRKTVRSDNVSIRKL